MELLANWTYGLIRAQDRSISLQ